MASFRPRPYPIRLLLLLLLLCLTWLGPLAWAADRRRPDDATESLSFRLPASLGQDAISEPLRAELQRLAALVDISYCVGTSGLRKPFNCLSRCHQFPDLVLAATWHTGPLMSDSCGYIALHHGHPSPLGLGRGREGAIIVAFRGTYSLTNVLVDLSTIAQPYVPYAAPGRDGSACANCSVHAGFSEAWQNARQVVLPELRALMARHPSYPVHLVGHSLGGAVACLAGLELQPVLGNRRLRVTTFGEPRVGNFELAAFIDQTSALDQLDNDSDAESRPFRRLTHINDPVPLLPPSEWEYRSHGGEMYIATPELRPRQDQVLVCVGSSDERCSAGAEAALRKSSLRLFRFSRSGTSVWEHLRMLAPRARLRLDQLFFAHRDYFWRLGLCLPESDPAKWGREQPLADLQPGEL